MANKILSENVFLVLSPGTIPCKILLQKKHHALLYFDGQRGSLCLQLLGELIL